MVEGMNLSGQKNNPRKDPRVKSGRNTEPEKPKRKWVPLAIAGVVLFSSGLAFNSEAVMASTNSAVATIKKATSGTEFKQKDELVSQKEVKTEIEAAYGQITAKWTDNKLEDVKSEIARQKDAGLPIYVIQWGDTLSVLAKALDVSIESLAKANTLESKDLIYTGDVLLGVLSNDGVSKVSPTESDSKDEVAKDEVAKDEVAKDEVAKDEVAKDEVAKDEVVKDEVDKAILPIVEAPITKDVQDEVIPTEEPDNVDVVEDAPITPVDVDKAPDPNPDLGELPDGMIVEEEISKDDGDNKELDKPVVVDDGPTVIPAEPLDESVGNDVDKDIIVEQDETAITYEAVTTIKKAIDYVADDTLATDETKVVSEGKDGSIKQTRKYGAYSDGAINHDVSGEEKRVEAEPKVIHYGPTKNVPVDKESVEVIAGRNLKNISVIGAINSDVFSYFVQSDMTERLTAAGYKLELTGDVIVVLGNPDDINSDVSEDLQLLFAYNSAEQDLKYKMIESTNKSAAAVDVLEAVAKLNAVFKASQLKTIAVEAKGIESNSIIMTLIDWSLTNPDKTNIKDINTDYQTFMENMESVVAQHIVDLDK